MSTVNFLPFARPVIDEDTIAGVADVLRSGWITSGPQVERFEAALSEFCGGRPVRTLNSGTAALELGLRLAGIGAGDEVITSPLSWVATANVILAVGARPVFVDIDPHTRNIDLDQIESAITPRTRALMPVYMAGLPVDLGKLYDIAAQRHLRVIEDAAQALGASWHGTRVGARGDLVAFSFHANKNVTTGEGGCIVLPDLATADRATRLRLQGVVRNGEDGMEVEEIGYKLNLTDVAARIGLGQLARCAEFVARRWALAQTYFDRFDRSLGCELPPADFAHSNWHMFQIVLPLHRMRGSRADFIAGMRAAGIGIGVHYPAIHLFALYRALGWNEGDFPHAERIGRGIATLPMHAAMDEHDVIRVCETVPRVLQGLLR
ncbi:MAG: DegT/DnrJ/EryC1/StrS aminotransferase family protein [Burkholderiaceae bacterium]